MADCWYLDEFQGPWSVPPFKTTREDDRYRTLSIKIERFKGDPNLYGAWATKVIHNIHRNPTTWSNKLSAIEACIDYEAPALRAIPQDVNWSPLRYVRLINWLEERFGGAKPTINRHADKILALPRCVSMEAWRNYTP
jgi:hypothetical protein